MRTINVFLVYQKDRFLSGPNIYCLLDLIYNAYDSSIN
jgi:hypothetical protein